MMLTAVTLSVEVAVEQLEEQPPPVKVTLGADV